MKNENFEKVIKKSIKNTIKSNSTNMKMLKSLVVILTKKGLSPSIPVKLINGELTIDELTIDEIVSLAEGLLYYFK